MRGGIFDKFIIGLFIILQVACQVIIDDFGDQPVGSRDNGGGTDADNTDPENTGSDVPGDSESAPTGDTASSPPDDGRAACRAEGRYWYDAEDVNAEDDTVFQALQPSCHDTPDEDCPVSGNVIIARDEEGYPVEADVDSTLVNLLDSGIVAVYSTLRCLTRLKELELAQNHITSADLMNNTRLEIVSFYQNEVLAWLGMPTSSTLRVLYLSDNQLSEIDLSYAENLEVLHASGGNNRLQSIDLENKPLLYHVELEENEISHPIDLSASVELQHLDLFGNPIGEISLPDTDTVTYLGLDGTGISSIDLAPYVNLLTLFVRNNHLTTLDVSTNINLIDLYVANNNLLEMDLSANNSLVWISLYDNAWLESVTMPSDPSSVQDLHLCDTALSSVDISNMTALQYINLEDTHFTASSPSLDFSNKPFLEEIYCGGTGIDYAIDLSGSPVLRYLNLAGNRVPSLVLPAEAAALENLILNNNELTELTLDSCPVLQELDLGNNNLEYNTGDDGVAKRLDLTACTALETVYLGGNAGYELSFLEGTFPEEYLGGATSRLGIETTKWDENDDPRKPEWTFNTVDYVYGP